MKVLQAAMIVMLAGVVLQACNDTHKPQNYNMAIDTDGDTSPDTTMKLKTLVVDKHDQDFAIEAIDGSMTEVALGRLAVKNGKSKEVKNFGQMMIKDHNKSTQRLVLLMTSENIPIPPKLSAGSQALIKKLSAMTGADFDQTYISCMLDDHTKDVQLFTDETKKLQDPELKNFAVKTLPTLKNHLEEISAIHLSKEQ